MNKTEKLKQAILSNYKSIREFSKVVDIPSTTLTSALNRGIDGMSIDKVIKICETLNIDIKTFDPLSKINSIPSLSEKEKQHLRNFKNLNQEDQNKVINYTTDLLENIKYKTATNKTFNNSNQIWIEKGKEHLMPIACHDDNLTDEERAIVNKKIKEILDNLDKY